MNVIRNIFATTPGKRSRSCTEPADIDERDPQHLRHDTRKAVEELYSKGILTYCLTLDPNADTYVKRIFGANNYTIVDHVDRLPEKLPTLFASLTS
jgi:nitric oxide reductase activation protein